MSLPRSLAAHLALPVIASPLFIVSNPDLVIAQCLGGIVGSFPALNARPKEELEAWAESYKRMIVEAGASEIVYTSLFTGVAGNYLKRSIAASGLDPDALPSVDKSQMNFGSTRVKPWKDVWGAGQGVGTIADVLPAAQVIDRLKSEYAAARQRLVAA